MLLKKQKKSIFINIWLLVLFICSNHLLSIAKKIEVNKNGKIQSISFAINFAQENDTIYIRKGTYFEKNIFIGKPLTIIGENGTIVDCRSEDAFGFLIKTKNFIIKNITIKNIGISYIKDNAAIKFDSCENVIVENIEVDNGFFSIYFSRSQNFTIRNCILRGQANRTESNSGNGIHLWYCNNARIEGNRVQLQRDGIYFEFVKNSLIQNNVCENNLRYGLHFMFSDSCSYRNNAFRRNGAGVAVMYTNRVYMVDNIFENNWGPSSYGLLLKDIKRSYVSRNQFLNNTVGIYMEGTDQTLFEKNNFYKNGWALRITGNCEDNTFRYNNFIANTFEVATNSSQNRNIFDRNYWSGYSGYDLNKDGIGDVPYIPVSLFTIIIQSNNYAVLLFRSFFVDILEVAEKIFPSIVPKYLVDRKPAMRQFKW
ncbi:nitrous oxide reductase family maturation protein NosD [Bacteroidetes/Chlorobi group bacterium Naka2016]|nr:MAG: nitrous oxide reductase family maturation protein NosD [Bacteroidetes/Chlorobi group bacterium Naka2016]